MHAFNAMNSTITSLGLSKNERQKVEAWFRFVENKLSRFQSDSELWQLNRSAGTPFPASAILYQVIALAEDYHTATDGLFNPYLGSVLEKLGYDRSFEQIAAPEVAARQVVAPAAGDSAPGSLTPAGQRIFLDPSTRTVTIRPGISLDLGGIAKGWSADEIASYLREDGVASGVVDAGGDIICWGEEAAGLQVGIADPFQPDADIVDLVLTRGAGIATSSTLKRRWTTAGGHTLHHLLDPRTLTSSDSDLVQVTVLAPSVTEAEVYAKCVLLLGAETGIEWLAGKQPGMGVIAVRANHTVMMGTAVHLYCEEGVTANE